MKIGILTFHNVPNYGAVLQAFALKSFVEKNFDAKTFIVDYKCVGNDDSFKNIKQSFYKINNVLKRIYKIAQFDFYIGRKYDYKIIKFEDFKKSYLSVSELKDTLKDFDVILCGSDQIWNPRITNGFQDVYFGVKKPKTTKYISYAASCGDISEFSVQEKENLLRLVKNLDAIGVREKSLSDYLTLNGVSNEINVDPTMLLNKNDYKMLFNLQENNEQYVLVYALQYNSDLFKLAEIISKKRKLKIKAISGYIPTKKPKKYEMFDASPKDFLNYFFNAKYIITNSFHGLAFSIIFRKDFNIILPNSRSARLKDLLKEISLEDRIVEDEKIIDGAINYDKVEPALNIIINKSKDYLKKGIGR